MHEMNYPPSLVPSASEPFKLDDGRVVEVPKATPSFAAWTGSPPGESYGGKAILDFNGRPAFAELAILWSFMDAGWDGVWMDSFGKRYLRDFWPAPVSQDLPPEQENLLQEIIARASGRGRPWDVFCWSSQAVVFAEAKRRKRDKIQETQIRFLAAALELGLPLSAFLLVEWSTL